MPNRERSWDRFTRNPTRNSHHCYTSVLDFLHTHALHLVGLKSTFALSKSKRVISIVTWNTSSQVVLTVVCNRLKCTCRKEDLKPSSDWDCSDSIERRKLRNITKTYTRRGRKHPIVSTLGVEDIGTRRTKVKRHVDTPLLYHETDSSNHGNAAMFDLSILEPCDGIWGGIIKKSLTERRAFVAKFDTYPECSIKRPLDGSGGASGSLGSEGARNTNKESS
mmetsp:Transcript_17026/g.38327  ORF Transcript_17026/g.38327 Transcript_17026/m.38327 type:complete len:221 (-) Transcript_17026:85-747(-)